MGRLPDVADEDLSGELEEMAANQRRHYDGAVLNSFRQTAHAPQVVVAASSMSRDLARAVHIKPRLSSLLNLRTAAVVGCPL